MAFTIRDFTSITAAMLNWLRGTTDRITDYNTGSVARTLLEAPAAEIEELYLNAYIGIKEAIPVSVFNTFGFTALPAESASGVIRFATPGAALATVAVVIPAGTLIKAPGGSMNYATLLPGTIGIGQSYVDVLAAAASPGVAGNVASGILTELVTPVVGVGTVTNPAPLINGRDPETDDERRTRFQGFISNLARGTKSAVEYGARTARLFNSAGIVSEYVASALVVEPWLTDPGQPVSLVEVYIHNGASSTTADLVEEAQRVIDGYIADDGTIVPGWKAAGVKVVVMSATDVPVNVTAEVAVSPGFDGSAVMAAAEVAIRAYIQGLPVGTPVLFAELVSIAQRDVDGIYNVTVIVPTADVAIAPSQKAIPGAVALSIA